MMVACALFFGVIFTAQPSMPQGTGDVKDVVTIDVLDPNSVFKQIWQPYIAVWKNNYYVVAYGLKLNGKADMGDIVCSISKDGGKNWSAKVMILDHRLPNGTRRYAYANPVLFRPEGQDIIWCFAMRCPLNYSDSEDSELCAAYSCDGGWSWQQVELKMGFHSPLITNAGVVAVKENGLTKYLLPVHRNTKRHDPKGDREQFVLQSSNLISWELAGYIPRPPEVWIHEGNIAEGEKPGELKIVMRTAQYEHDRKALDSRRAYSSVSADNGKTWSMAVMEPALYNTAAKGFFGKDATGRHIYVYNDGDRGVRKGLYYVTKEPGKSWSEAGLFYWDNNHNSYPTLLETTAGVWLCVWDSSNDPEKKRTAIRFGLLDLSK
ncbi:exo-alpha-sialidase [candidate division KSB1 bacterium]|nr:exo-alpha-sialidase [candidate division KSB1 bacterium]